MFFFLSKTIDFFLMPLSFILILLIYAGFAKNRTNAKKAILTVVVMMFLLCNAFLVHKAFQWWEYAPKNIADVEGVYDVGIVLTGGMVGLPTTTSDHPGLSRHADRLLQTYLLYKAGKINKILISGADQPRIMKLKLDDGQQSALLLQKWGVPKADILLEGTSRNTRQNAVNSAEILRKRFPGGRFILITSSFHLRRAVGCFQKAGIDPAVFPADLYGPFRTPTLRDYLRPDPDMFGYAHLLWREWVGYLVYKVMGYC
jgi:uncharacterized SAM-binding protein YcdF (DUF218 family)